MVSEGGGGSIACGRFSFVHGLKAGDDRIGKSLVFFGQSNYPVVKVDSATPKKWLRKGAMINQHIGVAPSTSQWYIYSQLFWLQ